jgi:PAS domain S-box-containing protein
MPHPLNAAFVGAFAAEVAGVLLAAAAFMGVRRVFPRAHAAAWSWAWLAAAAREAASLTLVLSSVTGLAGSALRAASLVLGYVQAGGLVAGALELAGAAAPSAAARRAAIWGPAVLAAASAVALAIGLPATAAEVARLVLPVLVLGAASVAAAFLVARRRPESGVGGRLLAGALAAYGAIRVYEAIASALSLATGRAALHLVYFGYADLCVLSVLALGAIVCLLDDERRASLAESARRRIADEKFARIFRSSPDAISIASLEDGVYVDVNEAFERAFGYARAEVVGRSSLDVGIWAEPKLRGEWVERLRKDGGVRDFVADLRTRSRQRRVCTLSAEVIDLDDTPHVVVTTRDMTDELAAEARLRDSEERLRLALDAARMGTWEWEVVTGAAAWSPGVDALVGLPAGTLAGARSYLDLVHPADRRKLAESIDAILNGPEAEFVTEHRVLTTAGTSRWLEARGRIDRDPSGKPLRVRGTVADVTARKEAHQALLDSEERLRRISEAAFEGIGFSENGNVVDANPQLAAMLGYTVPELLGRPVTDLVAPVDHEKVRESQRGRELVAYKHRAMRKDGTTFMVEVQGRPLELAGRSLRVTAVRDVSERARLEVALQRSETLSAVGELVTGVAHEVRTPLFSISATLDAYEGQLGRKREREEFLALLRSQVKRLTNLMAGLLDYARPPALVLVRGAIGPVVRRAVRSCAVAAAQAGITVVEDVAPGLAEIDRDEGRLEQVLENLLANAIQLSPRGSTVRLEAADTDGGVAFRVSDEGAGLPAGDTERLFQPFFTRRKGGTGLGLSIVRRIVEQHGGQVTAANRPEGGAVFTVWLPAARVPAVAEEAS